MLKLKKMVDFSTANYHGFTLKSGFWYGTDTEDGTPVATSGWCNAVAVSLYILKDGNWELNWVYPEDIEVEPTDIPSINFDGKMSEEEWEEKGESYISYEDYLWDNLPLFLRK